MNIGVIGGIYVKQLIKTEQLPSDNECAHARLFIAEPAGAALRSAVNLSAEGFNIIFGGRIGGRQLSGIQRTPGIPEADVYGQPLRTYLEQSRIDCTQLNTDPNTHTGTIIDIKDGSPHTRRIVYDGANGRICIPDIALFFEYADTLAEPLSALAVISESIPAETAAFAAQQAAERRLPFFSETGFRAEPETAGLLPGETMQKITQAILLAVREV